MTRPFTTFFHRGRDGRAPLMRRRRDQAREFARARRRATPPRLAGDLGGLEAAKRHGHATRRFPRSPTTRRDARRLRFCFSVLLHLIASSPTLRRRARLKNCKTEILFSLIFMKIYCKMKNCKIFHLVPWAHGSAQRVKINTGKII